MNYLELRAWLAEAEQKATYPHIGPNSVYFELYDRGKGYWADEYWRIEARADRYDVGFVERGEFDLRGTFASEDEACDWLYARFTRPRPAPGPPMTREELDAVAARMKARYEAQDAARREAEQVSGSTVWRRMFGRRPDDA